MSDTRDGGIAVFGAVSVDCELKNESEKKG